MKKITSLLVVCVYLGLIGGLLSINIIAQQKSSANRKDKKMEDQKKDDNDLQLANKNQGQTNTPIRSEQQLEILRQLIEQAARNGTVKVQVGARDFFAREELLKQLAPFQAEIVYKYDVVPYLVLKVDVSALIYLRDSDLVETIGRTDILLHTSTMKPPVRTPEELAYFQKLIDLATRNGSVRVEVRVRDLPAQDELLQQLAPFQIQFFSRLIVIPTMAVRVNAAALIFMRNSDLVVNVREDMLLYTSTTGPPLRTSQQLAIFQQLIEQAQINGTVRVVVKLNMSFMTEDNLTPAQSAAQREAVSLTQDELLRQLVPYQTVLVKRYDAVPYLVLSVDAAALTFMMYSRLISNVRKNSKAYPLRNLTRSRFGV